MHHTSSKRALITGGSGGVGSAVAHGLAQKGVHVVVSDLNQEACEQVAHDICNAGYRAEARVMDVTKRAQVEQVFDEQWALGGIDILVTSAAIVKAAPILEFDVADWQRIIDVNLTGSFHACQCAGRQMVDKGWGRIITMSSVNGQIANSLRGAYSCTKGGVDMLTRLLAVELGKYGVTANAVAPPPIDTPMIKQVHGPQDRQRWYDQMPIKRYARPQEIASTVCFLASDEAAYINGHVLNVDGGFMASGILLD